MECPPPKENMSVNLRMRGEKRPLGERKLDELIAQLEEEPGAAGFTPPPPAEAARGRIQGCRTLASHTMHCIFCIIDL